MALTLPAALPDTDGVPVVEPLAYAQYIADFSSAQPEPPFLTATVKVERQPHVANAAREWTYWHGVTSGKPEPQRLAAVLERLVRVPWWRYVLTNYTDSDLSRWWQGQYGRRYFCLWAKPQQFMVIVKEIPDFYMVTAYPITDLKTMSKKIKEYAEAQKAGRTF